MIELGSVYLIVRDFEKSVEFYKKLFEREVSAQNQNRFAIFHAGGLCLCILNGYFDRDHPEKVIKEGIPDRIYEDYARIANIENSRKVVINLGTPDLKAEHERIQTLKIGSNLTEICYMNAGSPYYYFCLSDPDDNTIEITGAMTEK